MCKLLLLYDNKHFYSNEKMYPFFFLDQGAGGFAPDFVQMAMAPNIKHIKSKGKLFSFQIN